MKLRGYYYYYYYYYYYHQIQNYWLKAFPATQRHIAKNFNAIIEEPEKVPDWLTTGITYLIPKSGDSKEVRYYRLNHHV